MRRRRDAALHVRDATPEPPEPPRSPRPAAGADPLDPPGSTGRAGVSAHALLVREFAAADTEALVALWESCRLTRPWNDPRRDIERRRALDDGLFLVGELVAGNAEAGDGRRLVASAMGGYEGHRGWVNYLAVHPDARGQGHGRRLMMALEHRLLERGCPKINLQVREGNVEALAFYARLGFTVDASISLGKRLVPDDYRPDEHPAGDRHPGD